MTTPSVVDVDKTTWTALDNNAQSPTMPTHQAGDLLFGFITSSYVASGELVLTGTGWTLLSHVSEYNAFHGSNEIASAVFYKVAASSSETAPQFSISMANASDVVVYLYSIRDVDTATWTKGAASVCYQKGGGSPYEQTNILPEAKNSLLIHYAIIDNVNTVTTTTNSWTELSKDYPSGNFAVTSLYKTQTALGRVTAPNIEKGGGGDGFLYTFVFIGVNETIYPQFRDLATLSVDLTTTVSFSIGSVDLYPRHFAYPTSTCWWMGGYPVALTNNTSDAIAPSSDRTWYLVGDQNDDDSRVLFVYAKAVTTETSSFTLTSDSNFSTANITIGQMVGVNSDHPMSLLQTLDPASSDSRSGYTPLTHSIKPQNTHIITLFGNTTPTSLAASSGYDLINSYSETYEHFSYATKSYESAATTNGSLSWTASANLNYPQSFVLNPYGKSEKTFQPTVRCIVTNSNTATTARTFYNVNLKVDDLVVFFGFTRGTSAQLNFATSLGTVTDILTKWDSTNGWNSYIKAIKITSAVNTSWTVTQSAAVGTGFEKFVTAVVFENVPPDTMNILSSENVDNTSDTTLNLSLTLQKVGFAIAYNQAIASAKITSPQWSHVDVMEGNYGTSYLTFSFNMSPELTTNTTTFTGNSAKMYVHGITLPGWSLGSPLFFGSPF